MRFIATILKRHRLCIHFVPFANCISNMWWAPDKTLEHSVLDFVFRYRLEIKSKFTSNSAAHVLH